MKYKIKECLDDLLIERPIFHSEADFQHEFAIKLRDHGFRVRLEKPYRSAKVTGKDKYVYLDIYLEYKKKRIGVELKYKTREKLGLKWDGEAFNLRSHHAQNLGRYDFIKDISRLHDLRDPKKTDLTIDFGYAVLLTNDSAYYEYSKRCHESKFGTSFLLKSHDGNAVLKKGNLRWKQGYNIDSVGKLRNKAITLEKDYPLQWSPVPDGSKGENFKWLKEFQYLLVSV